ncbi:protein containing planctomycete cytochrome C domain protein [Rhodopirellula baltica SH28]|uniref:Protein containing planctomycete cytochrome C domain protein n=1 Tax=Rhodopirellula baltica SH28 TaxID=993517 RepID=K5CG64_RHOBT|nr:PSD1 and planctomycete cytochrome C domain-containing protein [Rhodopirellula baltica]EKK02985.1 protein containing planctomycete cytochrome C domain protein [Rhodopirellula baltica SH28]
MTHDRMRVRILTTIRKPLTLWLLAILMIGQLFADDNAESSSVSESEALFVRRVALLLREKCLGCHGQDPDLIEGSLDLRSFAGLEVGGDSGEGAVVPGEPELSPLYLASTRTSDDWSEMPPKESEQLSKQQLEWLRDWIASGAVWPDKGRVAEIQAFYEDEWSAEDGITVATSGGLDEHWTNRKYDPAGLWAYQPVQKPERKTDRNPIDVLIEADWTDANDVAPRADRRTLIRRATYDLTGLPPTPSDVKRFLQDPADDHAAFEKLVERLLQSPHYGERMAQHWLDVVRYADSSGFANDFERGNAWRYRDYVIRSFNEDKPYDQFIREQIAGDEIDPNDPECLIATGFLRMGPWELTSMEVAKVARQRFLDDVTNSVGETFLGHSLQCARCHDHKFDPIPTRDYYSVQSVFATTQLAERKAEFLDDENQAGFDEKRYLDRSKQIHKRTLEEIEQVLLDNSQIWFAENSKDPAAWNKELKRLRSDGKTNSLFTSARNAMRAAGVPETDYPPKLVGFTPEQLGKERVARKGLQRLRWEQDRYQPYALAVYSGRTVSRTSVMSPIRMPQDRLKKGELESSVILTGGDPFSAGEAVSPGVLSVIENQVAADIPVAIEGRRAAFANWVAAPANPLTSRVIVNRLWQWHFGDAIAGNANNFGATGKPPAHPELLDWLAATLVEENWSIKAMHRRIMNSDVYCRSTSSASAQPYMGFQPRRLSAEELRDSMLAVTGELNPVRGGIPCRPEINQEVALQPRQVMGTFAAAWVPNPKPKERHRRSIYVLKLRGLIDPFLEVFNVPSPDFSCERRSASTVTPQVFSLFNGQSTHARALALADRVRRETHSDEEAIARCFELVLSRSPSSEEVEEMLTHWSRVNEILPASPPEPDRPPLEVVRKAVEENTGEKFEFVERLHANVDFQPDLQPADVDRQTRALADVCLVLLNCNEFVYVY